MERTKLHGILTRSYLATSDRGVAMLRQMLFDSLKAIESGQDPMGVVRESNSVVVFDAQFTPALAAVGIGFHREAGVLELVRGGGL